MKEIFEEGLRKRLDPEADLLDHGLNAHRFIGVMREFWLRTGIEFDVNIPYQHRSIRALAEAADKGQVLPEGKLIPLKQGTLDAPLFVYAGGASCFLEMQDLLSAMDLPDAIFGISLTRFERQPSAPATVKDEVESAVAAIRALQQQGPYRLLGYSFGGVCALELARALVSEGETVEFLAMLDTPLNDHNNRLGEWLPLMTRIVGRQIVSRLRHLRIRAPAIQTPARPIVDISPERLKEQGGSRLGHRLTFRFMDPRHPDYPRHSPFWVPGMPPRYSAEGAQLLRMKGLYAPERFDGHVDFYVSKAGSPVECPARAAWEPFLPQAHWTVVPGNHLSMLVSRRGRALGEQIGARIRSLATA